MRHSWLAAFTGAIMAALPLVSAQSPLYGQCGGSGYTGPTTCVSGATCVYSNEWYSQCLPGTASVSQAPTTTAAASGSVRTSPPSGALVVRASGTQSGEYSSLAAAVAALGTGTTAKTIFIYQGTYNGRVEITYKGPLTIYGYTTNTNSYTSNTVTIQNTLDSPTAGSLDNSSTLRISTAVTDIKLYNINVRNNYGKGAQAVAVSAKAVKMGAYGCAFYGYQDTLYAAQGKQYYANCYIEGAVDYIFGNAAAWFNKCIVASNGGGAITANSREVSTDPNWYVFDSCTVRAASGASVSSGSVYLGRPWRVLARVLYQKSSLSNIINSKGWTTMAAGATPLYYEYQNTGDGASTSGRQFLTGTSTTITKATLFQSDTAWIDSSYPA